MLTTILRRYKDYNPDTGERDQQRTLREYARLLGLNHATLSQIFNGQYGPSIEVMRALARTFPQAAPEIAAALAAPDAERQAIPA